MSGTRIAVRLIALAVGIGVALLLPKVGDHGMFAFLWEKVGVTVVALLPLSGWALWTAMAPSRHQDLTLSYIGVTAQRIGLLGTVIGIVAATIQIGNGLEEGAANAVTGALPAVGQALVSTAVGFSIAVACDFFRYLNGRREIDEQGATADAAPPAAAASPPQPQPPASEA